jgi:hypothetical protein
MRTVAFSGIDVKDVDVQVQISAGLPAFTKPYDRARGRNTGLSRQAH